jgi:hypothetical protein
MGEQRLEGDNYWRRDGGGFHKLLYFRINTGICSGRATILIFDVGHKNIDGEFLPC